MRITGVGKVVPTILIVMLGVLSRSGGSETTRAVVTIRVPADGDEVGRETVVRGTATLPAGQYLWVLARRSDFKPLWWPQREAQIDAATAEWSAVALFGDPVDVGAEFEVGVVVVDQRGHSQLKDYWVKAMKTNDWRPVQLPEVKAPPRTVRVRKVLH